MGEASSYTLRSFVRLLGEPVGDPKNFHCGRPHIGLFADGHHGHVAAIRSANDTDLLFVDVSGGHQKLRGVDFVLQVSAAQVLVVRLLESHPVTRRTADIRRDRNVAARGESFGRAAEGIERLSGRSTVRQHDPWAGAIALEVERHPKKCADDPAVERPVWTRRDAGRFSEWSPASAEKVSSVARRDTKS